MNTPTFADKNPVVLFQDWLDEATATEPNDPNAMCLATADTKGRPNARMMLLKGLDDRGFVFYTNLDSPKSLEIIENPQVCLCFHWKTLLRQVRVEGIAEPVTKEEADTYYASRPRGSRIGAWASRQSQKLESRDELLARVKKFEEEFKDKENPPRPENWSGFRVVPTEIEFWEQKEFRLHERINFIRTADGWTNEILNP